MMPVPLLALLMLAATAPAPAPPAPKENPVSVLNFTVQSIDGKDVALSQYQGKVLLIVNVASECGLTPQYAGLEKLHGTYSAKGFSVLGFPSNDFGGQEPAPNAEIQQFCKKNYGVTFPLFAKSKVLGDDKTPLYAALTSAAASPDGAGEVKWNFAKFLVGKDGSVAGRFGPKTTPEDPALAAAIEAELAR